jgi:hypothetical protein
MVTIGVLAAFAIFGIALYYADRASAAARKDDGSKAS